LKYIGQLYDIEREVQEFTPHERLVIRQERARALADALHQWMTHQRARVSEGSAIAKALDHSLRRWLALTRYLDDPQVPFDNN
jgi:transposase